MPFTGKVGDTLYLGDIGGRHRYIIISKPNSDGNVIIANFTSATYWREWVVTFTPKHSKRLFDRKTTVNYADARIKPVSKLVEEAKYRPEKYEFCPENLVKKIVIGALQSRFTQIEILEELKIQYPSEYEKYCQRDY
ncbi:MAG: hypothetical protein NT134_04780 [Chloroflexi bacterium]|nr:hypothetical protein [Chloroflexota bacterium]